MEETRAMVYRVGVRRIMDRLYRGMSRRCDCLPEGWGIHSVAPSPALRCFDVIVTHPSFPVVEFGAELPVKVCRCAAEVRYAGSDDQPVIIERSV